MAVSATISRFLRYAIVGVSTNALGYLLYLLVTLMGLGPKTTMSILYFVGAALGYFGNRRWAFRYSGNIWRSSAGYFIFHAGGYCINLGLLFMFVDRLGYPHQVVQAGAILVVAAYLFVALNLVVFKRSGKGFQMSGPLR